jgi:hypothetical protein
MLCHFCVALSKLKHMDKFQETVSIRQDSGSKMFHVKLKMWLK